MRTLLSVLCVLLCSAIATADPAPSMVTAAGAATLKSQPTLLRVTMQLQGAGKDLPEALAALAKSRDDAKAKLTALNPVEGSLVIAETSTGDGSDPRQRQYRAMLQQQRGGKPQATGVTVTSSIKAAFALSGGEGDQSLLKAAELEAKIKSALAGAAPKKALSPEEQEILEEMASAGQPAAKPGEPSFTYAFPITDDAAAKLTADAVAKAKAKASVLATAAGMKLGHVQSLVASSSAEEPVYNEYGGYTQNRDAEREATSPSAGVVSYTVTVNASFVLQ